MNTGPGAFRAEPGQTAAQIGLQFRGVEQHSPCLEW
jgi:hypothetical protein